MRMASGQDDKTPPDQRVIQCLILMIKEQATQRQLLNKLATDMGRFREDMYGQFEKMQYSLDFVNRKLSSGRRCVCGGDTRGDTHSNPGTKQKSRSPDNSDYDSDIVNFDRGKPKKRTEKTGFDTFSNRNNEQRSPVPCRPDPPQNVPTSNGDAARYHMAKAPLSKKQLLKSQPQETDFIELMKSLKVECNPSTIAAVSSAVQKKGTGLDYRPPALHTVVILDISESMKGKPFDTAKRFINKVIDGIDMSAGECGLEEYVAVITCGHVTGIAQPFTNDYVQIRDTLDNLATGGRTPLMTSLTLALCYLELQSECVRIGSHKIMPRVIIVSDFDATLDTNFKGRDADNSEGRIKVQRELFNLGLTYKSRGFGVFCVPIGESNRPVTNGFSSKSGGEIISQKGAQNVGNYFRYQVTIGRAFVDYDEGMRNEFDVYELVFRTMPKMGLDKNHKKAVVSLLEKILQKEDDIDTDEPPTDGNNTSSETNDGDEDDNDDPPDLPEWIPTRNVDKIGFEEQSGLPSIGSRVVRGKDWKWDNQDGNGPGTVVGHKDQGVAFILWDNGQIGAYRHNLDGQYDVIKSQEQRHVTPGHIEVGCCVVRGLDWNRGDEDGGSGTVGVVVRKLRDRYVMVRWPSRVIETYKFGADNKWDLEVTQYLPHAAEPEETLKPWWSWMDVQGQWHPFSEQSVDKLERKLASGLPQQQCLVDYENKPVKVFLSQNICEKGGQQYHVKREMLTAEEIESYKVLGQYFQSIN